MDKAFYGCKSNSVEQFVTVQSERDRALAVLTSFPCDGPELKIDPAQGIPVMQGLEATLAVGWQSAFPDDSVK